MRVRRGASLTCGVLALTLGVAQGQIRRPKAEVTPLVERVAISPGTSVRVALRVSLPEGLHVQSNAPRDPTLIPTVLTIDAPAGLSVAEIVYPPATDLNQIGVEQPLAVFEHEFAIGATLAVAPTVAAGELSVPAHLRYQACDEQVCYPPVTADTVWTFRVGSAADGPRDAIFDTIPFGTGTAPVPTAPGTSGAPPASPAADDEASLLAQLDRFTTLGTAGGYLGSSDFLTFIRNAESGVKERGWFEDRGPLAILFMVFLGGLALNLTPCVLPMIPINLAIIGAGAQAGSRGRGFVLGAVYGGAMALVYGLLGLIVILTTGTFGTLNASPWFNLAITLLFVGLGLAMFDVIVIDFSRFSSGFRPSAGRGTFVLAFTMGVVAALLAGACVAPVVIQVVLFSSTLYAAGTKAALALPFLLGVGMALPWPLAGAGFAAMPKPGAWMTRIKQAFGVLILATAAYYGYETYTIVANRLVDPADVRSSVEAKVKAGWHASMAEGLTVATRDQKPVLIDLWATWCKNCLTMDKTTLEDPTVEAALAGYVKIKYQAEDPDQPPARAIMRRFDAIGLPTYVILRTKE